MKAVLEKKENNKVFFNFELEAKAFEGAIQKAYLKTEVDSIFQDSEKEKFQERLLK